MQSVNDSADAELKSRHRAMWAMGDYPLVASEVIPDWGEVLVGACGVREGDVVLDLGVRVRQCGYPSRFVSRGASVIACDLSPELLDAGRRLAAERGADVTWGVKPMPRRSRSRMNPLTSFCPVSASCSCPITKRVPTR